MEAALPRTKTLLLMGHPHITRLAVNGFIRLFSSTFIQISLSAVLLGAAVIYVLDHADWPVLLDAMAQLPAGAVVSVTLSMMAGALLASLRLQWIARDLGYRLSFRDAMSALSLGQVMGSLFFQIAGQLLARSAIMSRRQVPASATIVMTGYERFAALAVSLSLALGASIYLFGKVSIDFATGGTTFVKLVIGLTIALVAGFAFAWGHVLRTYLPALDARGLKSLARIAVISVAIQLTTMAAYVTLAHALAPTVAISSLAAGSALVMLAASLPISFAGWGIREMSAIFVLATIGVPAAASLTVAITIGILGFAVVGVLAFAAIGHAPRATPQPVPAARLFDYGLLLDQVVPIAAASAVFFQVILPLTRSSIAVNLADPVVILGGSLFVLHHFGRHWPRWRVPYFNTCVALASAAMAAAYLHGLVRLGWTDWAFANRLLGWPVLLCYGATGALIVRRLDREGLDLLLRSYVAVAGAIVSLEIFLVTAAGSGATFLKSIALIPLNGFSQNRNAFAFVLLMAVSALLATHWRRRPLWLGIVFAGMVLAGSRAGFFGLAMVLAVAIFMAPHLWRHVVAGIFVATALVAATIFIPLLPRFDLGFLATSGFGSAGSTIARFADQIASGEASNVERFKSIVDAWQLFVSHPLFGAGLGVFMQQQIALGQALVIHSTPMWLLGEFGIAGFAAMAAPIVLIFRAEALRLKEQDVAGRLLILIITGFSVMSLAHELMYQRAFWLLLGAGLAVLPAALPATTRTPKAN